MKQEILLPNGETYKYLDIGTGNPIVLIHGNMSSSLHFTPVLDELRKAYRVIAPDLRGFGDSTYHTPIESLHDFADDLNEFMELLDIKNAPVLGWSTGGSIIMSLAARYPERVSSLILVESASHRGYPVFKKNEKGEALVGECYQIKEELLTDPVQVLPMIQAFEAQNKALIDLIWDQAIYSVKKPSKEDNFLWLDETMKQRNLGDVDWSLTTFNMSNKHNGVTLGDNSITNVKQPVLAFWGDKDYVVLEYMVDEIVEDLPQTKKIILENSGHSPFVDCPEKLLLEMNTFFSSF